MTTFAVVVGLELYAQPKFDVAGPAGGAVTIVQWLRTTGVLAANIFLFVTVTDPAGRPDLVAAIETLRSEGVRVVERGTYEAIDDCLRKDLPKAAEDARVRDGRLLFYWSGHGYAAHDRERYWVCEDFAVPRLTNRVIDGQHVCQLLRSYPAFTRQLVLVDACAANETIPFESPSSPGPKSAAGVTQRGLFATIEGAYARIAGNLGEFTRLVARHLTEKGWPDGDDAMDAIIAALRRDAKQPHWFNAEGGRDFEGRIGTMSRLSPAGQQVCALLDSLSFELDIYRIAYHRTVCALGVRHLAGAPGLMGMVETLDRMSYETTNGLTPALLQFILRLASIQECDPKLHRWIDQNATPLQRAEGRARLDDEAGKRILVVEIDGKGELLTGFRCVVRTLDLRPVWGDDRKPLPVSGWPDFMAKFKVELQSLLDQNMLDDFDIEFLAEPPFFHLPFHQIPIDDIDRFLGNKYVVVLRYRSRTRLRLDPKRAWQKFADDLRYSNPGTMALHRIPHPKQVERLWEEVQRMARDKGIYYTGFVVSEEAHRDSRTNAMVQLLGFGAPYLFWFHEPHPEEEWQKFELWLKQELARLEQDSHYLAHFPSELPQLRRNEVPYALNATLMWDDPLMHPLLLPRYRSPA